MAGALIDEFAEGRDTALDPLKAWVERNPTPLRTSLAIDNFNWDADECLDEEVAFIPWAAKSFDLDRSIVFEIAALNAAHSLRGLTTREAAEKKNVFLLPCWGLFEIIEAEWRKGKFRTQILGLFEEGRHEIEAAGGVFGPDHFADPDTPFSFLREFSTLRIDLPSPTLKDLDDSDFQALREALEPVGTFFGD